MPCPTCRPGCDDAPSSRKVPPPDGSRREMPVSTCIPPVRSHGRPGLVDLAQCAKGEAARRRPPRTTAAIVQTGHHRRQDGRDDGLTVVRIHPTPGARVWGARRPGGCARPAVDRDPALRRLRSLDDLSHRHADDRRHPARPRARRARGPALGAHPPRARRRSRSDSRPPRERADARAGPARRHRRLGARRRPPAPGAGAPMSRHVDRVVEWAGRSDAGAASRHRRRADPGAQPASSSRVRVVS